MTEAQRVFQKQVTGRMPLVLFYKVLEVGRWSWLQVCLLRVACHASKPVNGHDVEG